MLPTGILLVYILFTRIIKTYIIAANPVGQYNPGAGSGFKYKIPTRIVFQIYFGYDVPDS